MAVFPFCLFAQNLLWNAEQIDCAAVDPAYATLKSNVIDKADKYVQDPPLTVTDKTICRSGDPHNYESLSIYFWPDTTKRDGLPYVGRDGAFNPEYKEYDFTRFNDFVSALRYLSVAYRLTRDVKYFKAFCRQLDVWFINDATRMNPQFEYSQLIPGRNNGKGCAAGVVDSYPLVDAIESIYLVDNTKSIGRRRLQKIRRWFRDFADWIATSGIGRESGTFINNIGAAHDITLYAMYHFAGKDRLANQAIINFEKERIDVQIEDDGRQPLELARPRAFTYSVANLQYLMDYATIVGYVPDRVEKAIAFLSDYVDNKECFPYQEAGNWNSEAMKLRFLYKRLLVLKSNQGDERHNGDIGKTAGRSSVEQYDGIVKLSVPIPPDVIYLVK